MKTEIYDFLPEEAREIRISVFVKEQGFENEFDEIDSEAVHIVIRNDDGMPVATCRIFRGKTADCHIFGRLAVMKEFRGRGIGSDVVKSALEYVENSGGKKLMLHSQCSAIEFYEKLGFESFGEVEYEENCPHIWMKKEL